MPARVLTDLAMTDVFLNLSSWRRVQAGQQLVESVFEERVVVVGVELERNPLTSTAAAPNPDYPSWNASRPASRPGGQKSWHSSTFIHIGITNAGSEGANRIVKPSACL